MTVKTSAVPLSNEIQLGQSVNRSVQEGDGDSFRLLLSLLSDDVCDQAQFQKLAPEAVEQPSLRRQFQLGEQAPIHDINHSSYNSELTKAFHQGNIWDVKLLSELNPEPLAYGAESNTGVTQEIADLLSPWKRHKVAGGPVTAEPDNWHQADLALMNAVRMAQKLESVAA